MDQRPTFKYLKQDIKISGLLSELTLYRLDDCFILIYIIKNITRLYLELIMLIINNLGIINFIIIIIIIITIVTRSAFKILTSTPAGKRFLGRSKRRWENIIMDLKEIAINLKNWVDSAQHRIIRGPF